MRRQNNKSAVLEDISCNFADANILEFAYGRFSNRDGVTFSKNSIDNNVYFSSLATLVKLAYQNLNSLQLNIENNDQQKSYEMNCTKKRIANRLKNIVLADDNCLHINLFEQQLLKYGNNTKSLIQPINEYVEKLNNESINYDSNRQQIKDQLYQKIINLFNIMHTTVNQIYNIQQSINGSLQQDENSNKLASLLQNISTNLNSLREEYKQFKSQSSTFLLYSDNNNNEQSLYDCIEMINKTDIYGIISQIYSTNIEKYEHKHEQLKNQLFTFLKTTVNKDKLLDLHKLETVFPSFNEDYEQFSSWYQDLTEKIPQIPNEGSQLTWLYNALNQEIRKQMSETCSIVKRNNMLNNQNKKEMEKEISTIVSTCLALIRKVYFVEYTNNEEKQKTIEEVKKSIKEFKEKIRDTIQKCKEAEPNLPGTATISITPKYQYDDSSELRQKLIDRDSQILALKTENEQLKGDNNKAKEVMNKGLVMYGEQLQEKDYTIDQLREKVQLTKNKEEQNVALINSKNEELKNLNNTIQSLKNSMNFITKQNKQLKTAYTAAKDNGGDENIKKKKEILRNVAILAVVNGCAFALVGALGVAGKIKNFKAGGGVMIVLAVLSFIIAITALYIASGLERERRGANNVIHQERQNNIGDALNRFQIVNNHGAPPNVNNISSNIQKQPDKDLANVEEQEETANEEEQEVNEEEQVQEDNESNIGDHDAPPVYNNIRNNINNNVNINSQSQIKQRDINN